jgi:hypothetical protein
MTSPGNFIILRCTRRHDGGWGRFAYGRNEGPVKLTLAGSPENSLPPCMFETGLHVVDVRSNAVLMYPSLLNWLNAQYQRILIL